MHKYTPEIVIDNDLTLSDRQIQKLIRKEATELETKDKKQNWDTRKLKLMAE